MFTGDFLFYDTIGRCDLDGGDYNEMLSSIDKIKSYKCKVVLNLDQDNAGKTATISIGDMLIKNNIDTTVIVFDDYKDSDDYIFKKGKEAAGKRCNRYRNYSFE